MAASPKRVVWDACAWIALIQKEKIFRDDILIEDRYASCRSVIDAAAKGKFEIVTSGLCLVEVCKNPGVKAEGDDKIADFFDQDYILMVSVDKYVGTHARRLMMKGYPKLKPADATHLATAVVSNADEMHTFDVDLLNLDGIIPKLDGTVLHICKPNLGPPPPLLENLGW